MPQSDLFLYTHWIYFQSGDSAEACRVELADADFATKIDPPDAPGGKGEWLLRASKLVTIDDMLTRHDYVEEIVERHGGFYDGGESGWMNIAADIYPYPTNNAVAPKGWQALTDTNGARPMGWFTTARDGMRTVVRGFPTWDDAPFNLPEDCRTIPTAEQLDHDETDILLHTIFNLAYRSYVFPDIETHVGPATHSFANLDFCGGWRPAVTEEKQVGEQLLARTVAGLKPASDLSTVVDRARWAEIARGEGLDIVSYGKNRAWVAPARLGDRVDQGALTRTWQRLLDADPERHRRDQFAPVIERGLQTAFDLDLLQPIPDRTSPGLLHAWWDDSTDEGLVVLGAVLGYPPASTYGLLIEREGPVTLAIAKPDEDHDPA